MKKIFFITIIIIILIMAVGAVCAGVFYWYYLRGIGPTIKQPPQDIAEIIKKKSGLITENKTGMPLKLQNGFSILIFAEDLGQPRALSRDPSGNLIVSITSAGKIVALPDKDNNG